MGHNKRKRDEGSSSGSSASKKSKAQKAALSQPQPPQIVKIASVQSARECPPVIASTPGLCVPPSASFQAYTQTSINQKKKTKKPSAPSLMLHSSTTDLPNYNPKTHGPGIDYTAQEDGPSGLESHLKHYIAVFDPETGKLDVIEAKKMTVRAVPRAQRAPEAHVPGIKTKTELRNELGMLFGTKKAKKAISSITENAIGPAKSSTEEGPTQLDSSSKAILDSISEAARGIATKEQLQAAVDQNKPVPQGNYNATEIHEVYKPEEMIGADLLSAIPVRDWQDIAKKQSPLTNPNKYVSDRFWDIARGLDPVRNLRILRYLSSLLTIVKNLKKGKDRGSFKLPDRKKLQELLDPVPAQVIDSIRRKFSDGGDVRKRHMDLLKTYCCVLATILESFEEFDTEALRYDLSLTDKEFTQYYREIGGKTLARVRKEGKGKRQVARLSLPLEFPTLRTIRRAR